MNKNIRTRFAPSPTGFMHVGNLRTALYAWLLARSTEGKFVLRIEDTDQARYVEDAVDIIYATLKKAGLNHDEGPDIGGAFGPYIQSERKPLYPQYAQMLIENKSAYYCFCEKNDSEDENNSTTVGGCAGKCFDIPLEEAKQRVKNGTPFVIRQRIPQGGVTTFNDLVYGEVTIEHKVLDDQILLKQDGMPTYNFANVIDDHLMGITHVVRGSEYISSTPKYNLLYQAFNWEIPEYLHLPLIMGRDEEGNVSKLSKRHGAVSFENLVQDGYLTEAIINYIALLGWSPKNDRELFSLQELVEAFNPHGINKTSAIFDYAKLRWMNSEYIKNMDFALFESYAKPYAKIEDSYLKDSWEKIAKLLQSRVEIFSDIPNMIDFMLELPEYSLELFNHKKSKANCETAMQVISALLPKLTELENWDAEIINNMIMEYATTNGVKTGQAMWGIRIAVAGKAVTPGGPGEIMSILGKDDALRRLNIAIQKIQGNV